VFVDPVLALVCWEGTASSFEPEESLVEVFQPRL
jgi:hypothetical protein